MISVNQVTVSFGGFELFKDVSFMINPRDRIGLVGKNGAGKTTLMKIIAGLNQPDNGTITFPKELKIGYLPQQMKISDTTTVFNETKKAFFEIEQLKQQIDKINFELHSRTDYESAEYTKLIESLSEANERFDILGGVSIEALMEQTLTGLGFERSDFTRLTNEFSGGWRMRIELAKILLQKPNVVLLDEPTNHLDIESIQWLEDFLKDYLGAVVVVSHDIAFLDNLTNRTIEIALGYITNYDVPYSKYLILRKERREQQLATYQNQQKLIEDTEKFIERFRYKATKAVQVQSRIKQLEKIDRIEVEEEDTSTINIRFPATVRSGTIVVDTKNIEKRYGNHLIFSDITLQIERGAKIAFVGRNGEGKTTLAKIIMGQIEYSGELKIGHNVKIGYFAQNEADTLDEKKTVFKTIDDIAVGDIRTRIRDILGAFLFSGDTIDKKVSVLSGGERSRLALIKLLLEPYNVLVLDEPTNHLDIRTKEILKNALKNFDGTLILVSHDRDFLNGLVDKVYEFRHQRVKEHLGGIYEFLQKRKLESLKELEFKAKKTIVEELEKEPVSKQSYLERKEYSRKLKKIRISLADSETNIEKLENEIADSEQIMATAFNSDPSFFKKYDDLKKSLALEMQNWENISMELEQIEKEYSELSE